MEIITIPLSGEITHADSMGNRAIIVPGDVQRMSAGTGLTHSEYNLGQSPVHFYQIWIYPDQRGLPPGYDQRRYDSSQWHNRLWPVASGRGLPDVVTSSADATIFRAELDSGVSFLHDPGEDRRFFLYLTYGAITLNESELAAQDQARVDGVPRIHVTARSASGLVLIDLPSGRGVGYDAATLRVRGHDAAARPAPDRRHHRSGGTRRPGGPPSGGGRGV